VSRGGGLGRGIAFPPRIGEDGRWAWSEGPDNVRESIKVILQTGLEERVRRSGFGTELRRLLFQPNTASTHRLMEEDVRQALERWEPRIRLESVSAAARPDRPEAADLTITYTLVVSGDQEQVNLTLQLAG
jgi:uncharacterized protein